MGKLKVFGYSGCSTCKSAEKFLKKNEIEFESVSIVDRPPTRSELKAMLQFVGGEIKKLFNTSGVQYRELKIAEKLPGMSEAEALELLSKNGKLIKRPFVLTAKAGLVGFKETEWKKSLGRQG